MRGDFMKDGDSLKTTHSEHAASRISEFSGGQPETLIEVGSRGVCAAIWSHSPITTEVAGLPQHAIALHLSGSSAVEKWYEGRLCGCQSAVGSVSLVPAYGSSRWVLAGYSRVMHVYVDPAMLVDLAEQNGSMRKASDLCDFFAQRDDVTAGLIKLLLSHHLAGCLDTLAYDEIMSLLLRNLMRRYGGGGALQHDPHDSKRSVLSHCTLRKVLDMMEASLAEDIRLADIAATAHLSKDHFLWAFKTMMGQTPHQYLMDRRIAHSQLLLTKGGMPIAEIGHASGFRDASHFSAVFKKRVGLSPRAYQAERH
jgi:AraC family transcriptional regulator